jgi:hypothetical protein
MNATKIRKLKWSIWVVSALLFSLPKQATANASPPPACERVMNNIVAGKMDSSNMGIDSSVLCFWEFALQRVPLSSAIRVQAALQKSSATLQTGAPSGSNGATSAVSKPNTPMSLATEYGGITSSTSNQTMTLQTTLDGIPYALATHNVPYCWSPIVTIPSCISKAKLQWLNRVGLGITANTTTSSQNVMGTAVPSKTTTQEASLKAVGNTAPSLSSAFVKFTISDKAKVEQIDQPPSGYELAKNGEAITYALEKLPDAAREQYTTWQTGCLAKFTAANLDTDKKRHDYFARYYAQIVGILFKNPPDPANCSSDNASEPPPVQTLTEIQPENLQPYQKQLLAAFDNYLASLSIFEAQLDKAVAAAAKPILALEYDFNTPVNQPTTSTAKVILSKSGLPKKCPTPNKKNKSPEHTATSAPNSAGADPKTKKVDPCANSTDGGCINRLTGTLNAGGNFYNSTPSGVPGAGAFRDLQAGAEMNVAFCTSAINVIGSFLGNSTLGFTYYYQDQVSPSILKVTPGMPVSGISIVGLDASTSSVFAKKGPINFVQLKYGLGTGKNVKFPIAVSWSNRTDLITHSIWSAQFGVSYDFSSLLNSSGSANTSGGSSGSSP